MQEFLKALGVAATNPLAFVAYIAAVISWLLLRWRVDRNRNLLSRLNSIPAPQRAALLRDEMGIEEMGEGLSAEQRLRSRIHRYYFLAFVALCGVAVVLFAIAKFTPAAKPQDPNAVQKVEVVNDQDAMEDRSVMRKLAKIELRSPQPFVQDKLGLPNKQGKEGGNTCWSYVLPKSKVKLLFDRQNQVWMLYIVMTDPDDHSPLMGRWGFDDTNGQIGNFSLNQVMAVNVSGSSGNPMIYAEKVPDIAPSSGEDLYRIWTSEGYNTLPGPISSDFDSFLFDLAFRSDPNAYLSKLSNEDLVKINTLLSKVKPNAFAYVARPPYRELTKDQINNAESTIMDGSECQAY